MLRSMSFKNFIHFRDRQELIFKDGANFIIGASSTGKTACLELLRRCMSDKINKTTSSVPDKDELAYVVCHFQISGNFPIKTVKHVIACLFVDRDSKNQNGCILYKVLRSTIKNGTSKVHVQKSHGQFGCDTRELRNPSYYEFELKATKDGDNETALFNKILHEVNKVGIGESNSTKMDEIYKWLEDRYVGILPLRSFGPVQWTKSTKLQSEENYKIASERAEILTELLGSDKIDIEVEQKYQRNLITPFVFEKKDGEIFVQNTEKDEDSFKLLKCPEGIVEAKQLTLIISHKEFSTITLEEPDRGMHPHMIKKMRDLILRQVKGKTILIVTHNPSMINQWSMRRSFICSRNVGDDNTVSHHIRTCPENGVLRYGSNEEMKRVLFAPRVFFVEGPTDRLVFEAIFSFLTTNPNSTIAANPKLRDYLLATEVMVLDGALSGMAKMEICTQLMKENFILYDFDIFTNNVKGKKKVRVCGIKANVKFDKEYDCKKEFYDQDFAKWQKACENSRVFCWKDGDLEDQIIKILPNLETDIAEKIKQGKKNQTVKKNIKDNLPKLETIYIDKIAEAFVLHLKEFKRFISFLQNISKTNTPARGEKRIENRSIDSVHLISILFLFSVLVFICVLRV